MPDKKYPSALIDAATLKDRLGRVKILDASYNLPPASGGIPGAVDFDIDAVAAPDAPLAHTIPSPEAFAAHVAALGIGNGDSVVVYDRAGIYMAASRVWWMFRLFGHDDVRVLDGGLPAWTAAGYALAPKGGAGAPASFTAAFRPELFRTKAQIVDNLARQEFTVLDARDPARYAGAVPEPRPGIAAGHIPGSVNAPFMSLIDPATGRLKAPEEMARILGGIDRARPLACSCGSGVTAGVVALGLHETGTRDAAIYGGSWTEWGGDPALPRTVGAKP